MAATELPPPVGYICMLRDPDGNLVEFSWDQGVYAKAREHLGPLTSRVRACRVSTWCRPGRHHVLESSAYSTGSELGEEAGGLLGGVGADLVEVDARRSAAGDEHLAVAGDDVGDAHARREGDVPRRVGVVVRPRDPIVGRPRG